MRNSLSAGAVRAYFSCYALVYALLAVQNLIAMRYAKERHDEFARLRGLRGAAFMSVWTFPFLWSLAFVAFMPPGKQYGLWIMIGFAVAALASVQLGRYFRKAEARLQSA